MSQAVIPIFNTFIWLTSQNKFHNRESNGFKINLAKCAKQKISDKFYPHFHQVKDEILDVQSSSWYDDILKFRSRMKDIEVIIENLVNSVFSQTPTIDESVEAMAAFYNYAQRDSLKSLFERNTLHVSPVP